MHAGDKEGDGAQDRRPQDKLIASLTTWLSKQGYPLELRVARALEQRGWVVNMNEHFVDPQHGGDREIDMVAWMEGPGLSAPPPPKGGTDTTALAVVFSLTVECKTSRKRKPWVLFLPSVYTPPADETTGSAIRDLLAELERTRAWAPELDLMPIDAVARIARDLLPRTSVERLTVLHAPSRRGTAVVEAFRENEGTDNAYAGTMSAIGAAVAMTVGKDELHSSSSLTMVHFLVPIVVVEAPLLHFAITEDGSERIWTGKYGVVRRDYWTPRSEGHLATRVHVVGSDSLGEFLDRLTDDVHVIFSDLESRPSEVHGAIREELGHQG